MITVVEGYQPPWDTILARLIEREGGRVNDPADKGGDTNSGVTEATWRRYLTEIGETYRPLGSMTAQDKAAVFWQLYVLAPALRLDLVYAKTSLRELLLDTAVLFGPDKAARWLQEAIAKERPEAGLAVDGVVGQHTRAELVLCDTAPIVAGIVAERCRHHARVVQRDPTQLKFLGGWINRATEWLLRKA